MGQILSLEKLAPLDKMDTTLWTDLKDLEETLENVVFLERLEKKVKQEHQGRADQVEEMAKRCVCIRRSFLAVITNIQFNRATLEIKVILLILLEN